MIKQIEEAKKDILDIADNDWNLMAEDIERLSKLLDQYRDAIVDSAPDDFVRNNIIFDNKKIKDWKQKAKGGE